LYCYNDAMKFVHLHVHSHYSLLDGLPKIEGLVLKAKALGMNALALTDHGSLYGAIEFYKTAKKHGIKPIIGSEVYIAARGMRDRQAGFDDRRFHLTLLAQNNRGYKNLIKLVTVANLEGFYYKPRLDKEALRCYSDGLIALSGCLSGEIPRAIITKDLERAEALVQEYKDIFGDRFYIELAHHPKIQFSEELNRTLLGYAKKYQIMIVATCDAHYMEKDDAKAQDILMAVQTGAKLGEGDRLTLGQSDFSFKSAEEMYETFPYPKEALENTQKIADMCDVEIELGKIQLPYFEVPAGETPQTYLKKLCLEKMPERYAEITEAIGQRLDYELSVIEKTGFASYFLIVQDFVNWAKKNSIIVGPGRGSAAGSIVSYILNITNVDPIKYDLLFERFLNPERISMPDIDLDFADTGRDRVLGYVAEKYGRDRVAQIITFGTMAAKAAVRDTGRALGMPYEFCDKVAKLIPPIIGTTLENALENAAELKEIYEKDPDAKTLLDMAKKLEGVARHASTHACGVVMSKEPLDEMVPLQYATRSQDESGAAIQQNGQKQIVTQYEMHTIEDLGLLKMDFLGLKNLSIIERTLELVKLRRQKEINMDKIPPDDKKTFRLLQEANTTGVFQLESAGMKRYLKELKPTEFEDIVAMVALFRPGPMELISRYIERKHEREKVVYLHPKLESILKNTYGICIYQEQIMELVQKLAGFTLGEADVLRKAIGKKIKDLLLSQKEKFLEGAKKNLVEQKIAEQIWNWIEPFASYSFNRSHAVCYAMIGYQTAFLKAHFPAEFMASLMTSDFADVERVAFLVEEAKNMKITVTPPNINQSFKKFTVVSEEEIRFGLAAVKNVGENIVEIIIAARGDRPFSSVEDFISRVKHKDLNKKSMEALIKCGALNELGERGQLLENLEMLLEYIRQNKKNEESSQMGLFGSDMMKSSSLRLRPAEPTTSRQKLQWEKELLGLYVSDHPLAHHKDTLEKHSVPIHDITDNSVGRTVNLGGMVSGIKKHITKKGAPMLFANLQDFKNKIELVVFPETLEKTRDLWQEDNIVLVSGKVDMRNGSYKLICNTAKKI